jgi:DNA invertase Pin-like site-specific DNA recombinase
VSRENAELRRKIAQAIRNAHKIGQSFTVPARVELPAALHKPKKRVTTAQLKRMRELDATLPRAAIARVCGVSKATVTRLLGWKYYQRKGIGRCSQQ